MGDDPSSLPPWRPKVSLLTRGRWAFSYFLVTTLFFTWGFAYGLLDVLNAHFQAVFGITKLQSTMLQVAYFGAYFTVAPFAGILMKRIGYKKGIHLGLTLYSLGAIFFWPSAKFKAYGGFVASTFVSASGLCTLEVAANSYIAVLGSPKYAASRLNFSQGFQGVASFSGPLIAARWFFLGKNATTLDTVQWVYLAVAGLGVALNIMFFFCYLPEITEDALTKEIEDAGLADVNASFWRQYRCIFGFVAQTCYVGAQVTVASFVVNFLVDQGIGISPSRASTLFSYCQMTFTAGRFLTIFVLNFVDPALILTVYATMCSAMCLCVSQLHGKAGVVVLFVLFFFESVCYPCIFTLATKNLGRHTKTGSSAIVMGIGGGAWFPPAQGALADNTTTRHSYLVPFAGYLVMLLYAAGLVIDQTVKGGFRFRNVDEIAERRAATAYPEALPYDVNTNEKERSSEKGSEELVERVR
ncbi:MFS general substrate transporter [Rickenella mellea]|uniref:MFS general substrate transporter n=1 Tax=Rickenella mellea TaxID=50990 RepID=A0A4Y7QEV9_9AGAM|nr:MFS general substrate transporter [Rickenella mellea]